MPHSATEAGRWAKIDSTQASNRPGPTRPLPPTITSLPCRGENLPSAWRDAASYRLIVRPRRSTHATVRPTADQWSPTLRMLLLSHTATTGASARSSVSSRRLLVDDAGPAGGAVNVALPTASSPLDSSSNSLTVRVTSMISSLSSRTAVSRNSGHAGPVRADF
jgi:hypothetical protein